MKSQLVLLSALTLLIAFEARGDGATFDFNNRKLVVGVDAPVFDAEGVPLEGTNYLAELYGGATPDSLAPAVTDTGGRRLMAPFTIQGYWLQNGTTVSIPSVSPGGFAWLQVRAWDIRLGATYEAVVARGVGGYGESPLFYEQGAGASPNGDLPHPLTGLKSFRLRPARAVLMSGIHHQGNQIVIEWRSGFKRYQIQTRESLDQPWQNAAEPTTTTSSTNSVVSRMQLFRVVGLLE